MSGNIKKTEVDVTKKALKENYLKEIVNQLIEELELASDVIEIDTKGQIQFYGSLRIDINKQSELVRNIADKLAETKADQWLKDHPSKKE